MNFFGEQFKSASKNRVAPVGIVHPFTKDEHYTANVFQESNHESNPQRYSNDSLSRSSSALTLRSIPTIEQLSNFQMGLSQPMSEIHDGPQATHYDLDETLSVPSIDPIQQLINQVTSQNIETSKTALVNFNKMLLRSDMRSKCLEGRNVLSLFYGIIKQLDNYLSGSHDIDVTVGYKNIFDLCLNLFKYQELTLILDEEIVRNLISRLLYLLSTKRLENSTDTQLSELCINLVKIVLKSAPTSVTCALFVILYDRVKNPQSFSTHYTELVIQCIFEIEKYFQEWDDKLCYTQVLGHIHRFLQEFDSRYWEKQPSDAPFRTCKSVLHTMVKIHSDKVLECLCGPEFPRDSEMAVCIHTFLKNLNSKLIPENSRKRKHSNS